MCSGTACDVTRSANSLHDRADELMMYDVISNMDSSLPPLNVSFLSSNVVDRETVNIIGSVVETGMFDALTTYTHWCTALSVLMIIEYCF